MSLVVEDFSLCVREGNRILFDDFSLTIKPGEIAGLMGPSGSGKSSLLHFILGSLAQGAFEVSGKISLNEQSLEKLPTEQRGIGVLFQDPLLFPHMTVGENLAFGLTNKLPAGETRREVITEALRKAELSPDYAQRLPHTLSGGEQSRISLLRTLLSAPQAILLDEPFSKLDKALRRSIQTFVYTRILSEGIPALIVTHDEDDLDAIPRTARGDVTKLAEKSSVAATTSSVEATT